MKIDLLRLEVVLTTITMLYQVNGYSNGAPTSACHTLTPEHDVSAQSTSPEFTVTVSQNEYKPGDNIEVTLSGLGGERFDGFLVQARKADPCLNKDAVGSFIPVASTKSVCQNTSLTHINNAPKSNLSFTWKAPATSQGHIVIRATFVKSKTIFWVGVNSKVIKDSSDSTFVNVSFPAKNCTSNEPKGLLIRDSECGRTKGCFHDCTDKCKFLITWKQNKDLTEFKMSAVTGSSSTYVCLGLSSDTKMDATLSPFAFHSVQDGSMGSDSVIDCINSGTDTKLGLSYNDGKKNLVVNNFEANSINRISSSITDGIFTCSFTRQNVIGGNSQIYSLLNQWYLLIAYGKVFEGTKLKHDFRSASTQKADFKSAQELGSNEGMSLAKTHGCLMVIAWVFLAGFGIVVARYYKSMWPEKQLFKEKIWFQIHRGCMIFAFVLVMISFIIIFADIGGYSQFSAGTPEYLKIHPILGILVMILTVINPTMALFRPHPNSTYRSLFNWSHWGVGTAAHILAVAAMFIGINLPRAGTMHEATYILAACVVYQILVVLFLEALDYYPCNKTGGQEGYEMQQAGFGFKTASNKVSKQSPVKTYILMIHLFALSCFTIAFIVLISI